MKENATTEILDGMVHLINALDNAAISADKSSVDLDYPIGSAGFNLLYGQISRLSIFVKLARLAPTAFQRIGEMKARRSTLNFAVDPTPDGSEFGVWVWVLDRYMPTTFDLSDENWVYMPGFDTNNLDPAGLVELLDVPYAIIWQNGTAIYATSKTRTLEVPDRVDGVIIEVISDDQVPTVGGLIGHLSRGQAYRVPPILVDAYKLAKMGGGLPEALPHDARYYGMLDGFAWVVFTLDCADIVLSFNVVDPCDDETAAIVAGDAVSR